MSAHGLSRSRFCCGLLCVRQLWWPVHEPDAPELARAEFPGGVGIGREYYEVAEKIADTQDALAGAAPAVYEASFSADGVFVAVGILERLEALAA